MEQYNEQTVTKEGTSKVEQLRWAVTESYYNVDLFFWVREGLEKTRSPKQVYTRFDTTILVEYELQDKLS